MGVPKSVPKSYLPSRTHPDQRPYHWHEPGFETEYPALYELLSKAQTDAGPRKGATLSVFCDAGNLKARIWDPSTEMTWFATLDDWKDILTQVEGLLALGKGEWREKRPNGSQHATF